MPKEISAKTEQEKWEALQSSPGPAECPWMRVEITGETGTTYIFALAIWKGWVVAGAPLARMCWGQRAKPVWQLFKLRGAKLERLDPPHDDHEHLLRVSYRDFHAQVPEYSVDGAVSKTAAPA